MFRICDEIIYLELLYVRVEVTLLLKVFKTKLNNFWQFKSNRQGILFVPKMEWVWLQVQVLSMILS